MIYKNIIRTYLVGKDLSLTLESVSESNPFHIIGKEHLYNLSGVERTPKPERGSVRVSSQTTVPVTGKLFVDVTPDASVMEANPEIAKNYYKVVITRSNRVEQAVYACTHKNAGRNTFVGIYRGDKKPYDDYKRVVLIEYYNSFGEAYKRFSCF